MACSRVVLVLAVCAVAGFSEETSFEGRRIVQVQYDPAVQPLDPKDLGELVPLQAGEPYRGELIASAIDRLYATGRYQDIQVDAEPSGDGVILRFLTKERWFIGHVGAEGKISGPPDRGQLIGVTGLELGAPVEDDTLKNAEANLRRLLERNGLYEANIDPHTEKDPNGQQIHFTFYVKSGKRARYAAPVIQGDTKLPEKTIIRATGWTRFLIGGYKQVTAERTRRGVNGVLKKYQSQDRLTAQVRLQSMNYDQAARRLQPVIGIEAGPKVKIQTVEAKVSKSKLKKYVPVYQEQRLDRDLLVEGARNLRDYFQLDGYYDVSIDFRQKPVENDTMVVEYVVAKGRRYKLERVDVTGNKYFTTDTIRERMILMPASLLRFRHGRYSEAFRKKDEENIENLYRANGFRDVKVTSEVNRNHQGKAGEMAVSFRIEEGPQWFVDKVTVNGARQISEDEIARRLSSLAGQPYSDYNIALDRNSVLTYYFTNGFPDANFQYDASPAGAPNRVNLVYNLVEGRRQYVRDVLVTGARTTRQSLVDRNIRLDAGDPLSPLGVTESQKQLYDLGIFARVNSAIQNRDGETERKYAIYDLEEANRYRVNIGLGAEVARFGGTANSLDQPAGATGFSPRVSLDLTRMNFLGLGHTLTLRGRYSTLRKLGSFSYLAPRFRNIEGRNITFTALYDNARDVRTFSSQRQEASIQISQQFSKPTTGLFRFTYRRVSTGNVVIPSLLVPQLLQPVRLGLLSANIVQDRRDNPAETTHGIFNTGDFGVASRAFGSQRSFLRGLARNAMYFRLGANWVLARELTFGAIIPFAVPAGLEHDQSIPLPERFFGGGSNSLRGFPENQAGPRDIGTPAGAGGIATSPTGFPLGGNATLVHMTELRFPLIGENIRGVFFHDMGNIYKSLSDISFRVSQRDSRDFNYMVHAAGFGIRYRTPIGPIRLDLAYSINPPAFVGFKGTPLDLLKCNPALPSSQLPGACQGVPQQISHFQFFFSIGQTF